MSIIPHPAKIKNCWLRRTAILVTLPYAIGLALYGQYVGAKWLWRSDYIPPTR